MEQEIIKNLLSIGLSKNESNLYYISLITGPASAIQLAKKIGVTRQMVYLLLPEVERKGLIKRVQIGKRSLYQAADPETIIDIYDQYLGSLKDLVPELKSKQATAAEIPDITVYENIFSMREWYRKYMEMAALGDELFVWSTGTSWYELDKSFYQKFIDFQDKTGVTVKIIAPDNTESRALNEPIKSQNRQIRYTKRWWAKNTEKWVWRDQVCFLTIKENSTNMIVINSRNLAALERFDFENSWRK
jgi:sugar-specific transcriptional regulator TrmB